MPPFYAMAGGQKTAGPDHYCITILGVVDRVFPAEPRILLLDVVDVLRIDDRNRVVAVL